MRQANSNLRFPKVPRSFAIVNIAILIYCLPLLILGQDAYLGINDQLDSHIIWYRILASNGLIFADSNTIIQEMMSAPRLSFYNEFFLLFWMHYLLDTFPAMVINLLLIHFVAAWGMYFLLDHFKLSKSAVVLGSIFFGVLPFAQYWGLSVAGQPLVLLTLLHIDQKGLSLKGIVFLIVYSLYSNFYAVSFFFLCIVSFYFLIRFIKEKKINFYLAGTILSMVILALVMEYRLIESLFWSEEYVSSRVERNVYHQNNGSYFFKLIFFGDLTARSFLIFFIPPGLLVLQTMWKKGEMKLPWHLKFLLVTFLVSIFLALLPRVSIGFTLLEDSAINIYQFNRLFTILPLCSALIGAILLHYVFRYGVYKKWIKGYMILSILLIASYNPTALALIPGNELIGEKQKLSFRSFFAEELFTEVRDYLGEEQNSYKVASLGIYPSISQYNGFHTIDGYLTNYPLEYKKAFRKIIADELSANVEIQSYFDDWGSRCYLFDDQLGRDYLYTKDRGMTVNQLTIDCFQFKKLGGRYIISAVRVEQFSCAEKVKFHRSFEDETWKLFLYEIH